MPTNPAAGCGPAPAAAWDRKWWIGSLRSADPAGPPAVVGVTEHSAFASACSVLVDASQAIIPAGAVFYVAVYATSLNGGRQYQAQFTGSGANVGTPGTIPSGSIVTPFVTSNCLVTPTGVIVRASGLAASLWGVEMTCVGAAAGDTIQRLWVGSIAHGRERWL